MTVVRLTSWEKFAIDYGEKLFNAIYENTILLACGISKNFSR